MNYIYTEWKQGAAFTHGLTADEYYYTQFSRAIQENVEKRQLPCLSEKPCEPPREITTGKLLSSENSVLLENISAKNGYNSNKWIYGADLEKLSREGINIRFQKPCEAVLLRTQYANANHLHDNEIYVSEGGTRSQYQFFYNYDALDDRSKKLVSKYLEKSHTLDVAYTNENRKHASVNEKIENDPEKQERLNLAKERFHKMCKAEQFKPFVAAEAAHQYAVEIGNKKKRVFDNDLRERIYTHTEKAFKHLLENEQLANKDIGKLIARDLGASVIYARTVCAKDMNMENTKLAEEKRIQAQNREMVKGRPSWERER